MRIFLRTLQVFLTTTYTEDSDSALVWSLRQLGDMSYHVRSRAWDAICAAAVTLDPQVSDDRMKLHTLARMNCGVAITMLGNTPTHPEPHWQPCRLCGKPAPEYKSTMGYIVALCPTGAGCARADAL